MAYGAEQIISYASQARNESAITALFSLNLRSKDHQDHRLPVVPGLDQIVYEMSFRYGRADMVVFHHDGSATVIEVKNGDKGAMWVMAGLGQVTMYALQLALNKGALTRVRKALLWTSTGDLFADALIETACESAGVIPLAWGRLDAHIDALRATLEPEAA